MSEQTKSSPSVKPIRCLLDIRDIPLEHFRHSRDSQRKWKQSARGRHELLFRLSSWADPDGTVGRFSPSMDRLEKHFGHGSLYRRMDDLRDLGFLNWQREKPHYGQRQYEITLPEGVLKHLPDSFKEEITPPTLGCDNSGTPPTLEKTPPTTGNNTSHVGTNPSSLPSEEPPKPTRPKTLVRRLGRVFARTKGSALNKQGKEGVLNLAEEKGEDRVELVWGIWIKTRNLEGLSCPFFKFVEEFEETEAAMEKHAEDIQAAKDKKEGRTKVTRQVEDSEGKRRDWRIGLEAATDIDAYAASNPFPVIYRDGGDGTIVTLASGEDELIEDARAALARRQNAEAALASADLF